MPVSEKRTDVRDQIAAPCICAKQGIFVRLPKNPRAVVRHARYRDPPGCIAAHQVCALVYERNRVDRRRHMVPDHPARCGASCMVHHDVEVSVKFHGVCVWVRGGRRGRGTHHTVRGCATAACSVHPRERTCMHSTLTQRALLPEKFSFSPLSTSHGQEHAQLARRDLFDVRFQLLNEDKDVVDASTDLIPGVYEGMSPRLTQVDSRPGNVRWTSLPSSPNASQITASRTLRGLRGGTLQRLDVGRPYLCVTFCKPC